LLLTFGRLPAVLAQECIDSARSANSDAIRTQFLELAQLWLTAAVQVELRKGNGGTIWSGFDQLSKNLPD
jgi:hypothetical protein